MPWSSSKVRRARPLLGTLVEIGVRAPPARAAAGIERAFEAIARVHALMSFHEAGSDVQRLNRAAHKEPVGVDPDTFAVLEAAERLSRASDGAFDITVAPALVRFGFLPAGSAAPPRPPGPGHVAIELTAGCRVRFRAPLWIDLGGIAKGYAVDRAAEALEDAGIEDYVVNAGGDLRVGCATEVIHVRHPARPDALIELATLSAGAIATSAQYFAGRPGTDGPVHPIIAPGRDAPARYQGSLSVMAECCTIADALTKVVAVRGAAAIPVLEAFGASAALLSTDGRWQHWSGATARAAGARDAGLPRHAAAS